MQEKIIILDFGSQYTQLIARRIRELNTYCEIYPYNKFPADDSGIIGVVLSGSPYSVNDPKALRDRPVRNPPPLAVARNMLWRTVSRQDIRWNRGIG